MSKKDIVGIFRVIIKLKYYVYIYIYIYIYICKYIYIYIYIYMYNIEQKIKKYIYKNIKENQAL